MKLEFEGDGDIVVAWFVVIGITVALIVAIVY